MKVLWGHGSQPQCITPAVGAISIAVGNEDYNVAEGLLSSDFIQRSETILPQATEAHKCADSLHHVI